ncbi:MAG: hypothetical protein HYY60_00805 [Parcubacteria group bacterium]|nr:hypothetical protein [Parcubacteria group bacterium]
MRAPNRRIPVVSMAQRDEEAEGNLTSDVRSFYKTGGGTRIQPAVE